MTPNRCAHVAPRDTWELYDELGRPKNIYRNGVKIAYTYDDAGRLTLITNDNGTKTVRTYDDANRLTQVRHEGPSAQLLTQIDYNWRLDNTIDSRTETDATVQPQSVATVTFEYDNRRRLTREKRVVDTQTVYDIAYTYDQLGNRLTKVDGTSELVTTYFYDTVAANRDPLYQTNNNRLLRYEEKLDGDLQRTVSYVYYKTGDVSNITVKDEGTGADFDWYRDLAFTYYTNGSLGVVLWDRWKEDGQGTPIDYERLSAKEFRNHSPRARFLARDVDPAALPALVPVGTQSWTDYDGVQPYNDFDVTLDGSGNPVTADTLRYTAGFGVHAEQTVAGATEYLHGDLIRSTTLTTDDAGATGSTFAYTAFGEAIGTDPTAVTRYGYAGGWGYESGLLTLLGAPGTQPVTLQHLGARWYQPDIGRFVQRDPIGITGGFNVYAYALSNPLVNVDPKGEALPGSPTNPFGGPVSTPVYIAGGVTAAIGIVIIGTCIIFAPPTLGASSPGILIGVLIEEIGTIIVIIGYIIDWVGW